MGAACHFSTCGPRSGRRTVGDHHHSKILNSSPNQFRYHSTVGFFDKLFGRKKTVASAEPSQSQPRDTIAKTHSVGMRADESGEVSTGEQQLESQPRDTIAMGHQIAMSFVARGNVSGGQELLEEALRLCDMSGEVTNLRLQIVEDLAKVLASQGNTQQAVLLVQKNEELFMQAANKYPLAWLMHTHAVLIRSDGDPLGAMKLLKQANEHCVQMADSFKSQRDDQKLAIILQLQRRIVWDMPPDAAKVIGVDRSAEYQRVLDEWVAAAQRSGDPEHIAESLYLHAISPSATISKEQKEQELDMALKIATKHRIAKLAQAISATKHMLSFFR